MLTIPNCIGKEPLGACKSYDKTCKKKIDIEKPHSVAVYNKFMGGVDKADMLLSLYCTECWSRKWYHRIGFHLFSLAAVNSWLFTNRSVVLTLCWSFSGKFAFLVSKVPLNIQIPMSLLINLSFSHWKLLMCQMTLKKTRSITGPCWWMCQIPNDVNIVVVQRKLSISAQNAKYICVWTAISVSNSSMM